jgi:hypothetical protein
MLPEHSKADLHIVDSSGTTVLDAQLKMGTKQYIKNSFRGDRYSDKAKVVPQGLEDASKGHTSQLRCGGACSTPLSRDAAQQLAHNPSAHFNTLRPTLLDGMREALSSGVCGAASGAVLGAALATAGRLVHKGSWRLDREDAAAVGEAAGVSAVVGGAAGAVSALCGGLAGGAAAGVASALYGMYSSTASAEQWSADVAARTVFQGAVAAAAVVSAGGVVGPVLAAATGPGAFVLTPLVCQAVH